MVRSSIAERQHGLWLTLAPRATKERARCWLSHRIARTNIERAWVQLQASVKRNTLLTMSHAGRSVPAHIDSESVEDRAVDSALVFS